MAVTEAEQQRVVGLLLGDLRATIGTEHDRLVEEGANRLREFMGEPDPCIERVVDDVQQDVQDFFIDTTWPTCPRHRRHPLWFHDGGWWCHTEGIPVAILADLASTCGTKRN
jgi:hypothetical protein